ncbi:protein SUPPRESSOR OF FRI 4 isoform X3 [Lycium barbarum]|uniref:protein SUPPRESSOR OF FRI 4 isoform X3 n=1 Tax=Lycium barbarum TaxID=112863 RepID=UPI00293EB076|nr:protein SUPPRESSOR OF FRI 4 isoform X3 [Lycium barbarum]
MERKMMSPQQKLPKWTSRHPSILVVQFQDILPGQLLVQCHHCIKILTWIWPVWCSYNPAVPMPPAGWPVPPRHPPWYPQYPAGSVPPAAPMGLPQQPLFPVQNVRPPMPATAPPTLVAPPGLPTSTPPVSVSQPLFPVVPNNNNLAQSSPFSAPMLSTGVPLSSAAEAKSLIDPNTGSNTPATIGYQISAPMPVNSHSYASGPNTGGPSYGPPPVISNKAPANQPATNEVYLVWDDEAMSMEERRMSLPKYQVHDETSQVSYNYLILVFVRMDMDLCCTFIQQMVGVSFISRIHLFTILSYS